MLYVDGTLYDVHIVSMVLEHNTAKAGGSSVFHLSNDRRGDLSLNGVIIRLNTYTPYTVGRSSSDQHLQKFPGIFYLDNGAPTLTESIVE